MTATTIYIVEDSEADWLALARALRRVAPEAELKRWRRAGDLIAEFERGQIAGPSMFFVDIDLPGLDGHWLVQYIRRQAAAKTQPVFVVSGSSDPSLPKRSRRMGASAHLRKLPWGREWEALLTTCFTSPHSPESDLPHGPDRSGAGEQKPSEQTEG